MPSSCDFDPTPAQRRRWRRYVAEERLEASVYRDLASRRDGEEAAILEELARAEKRHEEHWLQLLGPYAEPIPRAGLRSRILPFLARYFGSIFVLALAQRSEQRGTYDRDRDATAQMAADEQIHSEVIRSLAARSRQRLSGSFRAAVFGANDGLVSNLALVLGVGATGISSTAVMITGITGLLAGALSMAAGEYVSVRSQRELLEASVPDPRTNTVLGVLDVNANELALVYRARGESEKQARLHAAHVLAAARSQGRNIATLSEQQPGVSFEGDVLGQAHDESATAFEEVGTGMRAAISSFFFFAAGAGVPIIPFILGMTGSLALLVATVLVGCALLVTGGVVGVLSGQPPFRRALRQLLIGYGAAAVTYGLGLLVGTDAAL
ncbi:VIT1/CCC1 transporter family protein [Actinomyces vulturis]|uniref:VIT1/CCC1 transporter family protein n=1 Tax=Actinomyces vulturis TaxID=1857645 RepID=UPI00082A9C70|nr:VIT1/CCC1 transporter family protein [Actinomyces vulturis]